MTYEVTLEPTPWKICPPSGTEEVIQNVKCLLLTAKGTVWNYREFGLNISLIDTPLPVAQQRFIGEVVRTVNRYEPRAKVRKVRWARSAASDGVLRPVITLEVQS